MIYFLKNRKFHIFILNFQVIIRILNQPSNMKKGFSQFPSNNKSNANSQDSESQSQNQSSQRNVDLKNVDRTNPPDKKAPVSGFSAIKKQHNSNNASVQNGTHISSFQTQMFPVNNQLQNMSNSNIMQNGNFGQYSAINNETSQFFPNNMNSFGDNSYAMLFNQLQNISTSFPSNHGNSQGIIMTLFQIIENQAKSLQSLYAKVDRMTQKINQFGQKMKQMKKNKKQLTGEEEEAKPVIEHIGQTIENIDSKTLIKILFGSNKVYNYRLELNEPLELPLYRERNFSISLKLTDQDGKLVKNNNKIPLSLAIYSSQNPPKFIQKNTAGQKILKGYIEQSLHFGQCRFQKIQIKEVTSHFRNGWVFIVIIPCMTPLGSANPNDNFIDYLRIQPLVLDKVIVKAKKIKESNKKGKQEKQDSEMVEPKDSELPVGQQKVESKDKRPHLSTKGKVVSNVQQSEDIFQDK